MRKLLYKIGFIHIGYKHKLLTPIHRIIEPFVMIFDGLIGVLLLPTPYLPHFTNKLLRSMIKAQCKKHLKNHKP